MTPVRVTQGSGPIVLGQPHGGTFVPADIMAKLNERGQGLDDTDWHINRLYSWLLADVTVVEATFHRYVVDANRDPAGTSLYPGQNTTTLCPTTDFDGDPIWRAGEEPSETDIKTRRDAFHAPYHAALQAELDRVADIHGCAVLFDCHSIRSNIPFLFDGQLPVFNIGTNKGLTCDAQIESAVHDICAASEFSTVINGRFKGGWTTRHYGKPNANIHAIQMELAQRAYMDEHAPWSYREDLAETVRPILADILQSLDSLARSGALTPQERT